MGNLNYRSTLKGAGDDFLASSAHPVGGFIQFICCYTHKWLMEQPFQLIFLFFIFPIKSIIFHFQRSGAAKYIISFFGDE